MNARMAELADALYSGCSVRMDVQVRLLFRAPLSSFVLLFLLPLTLFAQLPKMSDGSIDVRTQREIADGLFKSGLYQQALPYYENWLRADPKDTAAYILYARCLTKLQRPENAIEALAVAARVGYAYPKALTAEPDFINLQQRRDFKDILATVRQNEAAHADIQQRLLPQTRFGRYAVLYPPGYDAKKQYHLLLMLHGNGQEPAIMLRWAKELNLSDVIIVCPEAPYVKATESIAQGKLRYSAAAEDIITNDTLRPAVVEESAKWYLSVLADAEKSLPIYKELPLIVGFSQGGFYTNVLISRQPKRFRAAVVLSASHYAFGGIEERLDAIRAAGVEVLHTHGKQDPIVPFKTAEYIEELYAKHNVVSTFIPYEGVHWMTADITRKVADWIKQHYAETIER